MLPAEAVQVARICAFLGLECSVKVSGELTDGLHSIDSPSADTVQKGALQPSNRGELKYCGAARLLM